jgi:predicted nucleic-acid-binding protein
MIGLDTNVLVRYVTQDDPKQSAAATKLIDSLSTEAPGFIAMIVVVELVWVLQSCYQVKRDEIVRILETLLRSKELIVERAELVWQALRHFTPGQADFADCLIERCGHAAECRHTLTFDRNAAAGAGMQLLKV